MPSHNDALLRLMAEPDAESYSMAEIRRRLQLPANEEVVVLELEPRAHDTWLGEYVQVGLEDAEAWEVAADDGWGPPSIATAAPAELAVVLKERSQQHRRRRHRREAATDANAICWTGVGVPPPAETSRVVVERYVATMAESWGRRRSRCSSCGWERLSRGQPPSTIPTRGRSRRSPTRSLGSLRAG